MRERVNPRVNRDLPKQAPPPDTRVAEMVTRKEDLHQVFSSEGWKLTVIPNLNARMRAIERTLAVNRNIALEELRRLQARHELLDEISRDPVSFFTGDALG